MCSYINDSPNACNAIMKYIAKDRIGLFALQNKNILEGEELLYSYSKGNKSMPWRKNENLLINFKNPGIQKINNPTLNCKYCDNDYKKNNALQKKKDDNYVVGNKIKSKMEDNKL